MYKENWWTNFSKGNALAIPLPSNKNKNNQKPPPLTSAGLPPSLPCFLPPNCHHHRPAAATSPAVGRVSSITEFQ